MSGSQAPVSNWLHSHSAAEGNPIEIDVRGESYCAACGADGPWDGRCELSMQLNIDEGHRENSSLEVERKPVPFYFMNKYSHSSGGPAFGVKVEADRPLCSRNAFNLRAFDDGRTTVSRSHRPRYRGNNLQKDLCGLLTKLQK